MPCEHGGSAVEVAAIQRVLCMLSQRRSDGTSRGVDPLKAALMLASLATLGLTCSISAITPRSLGGLRRVVEAEKGVSR